ncbi:hypothetical protein ACJJI4_12995 [Microbulbifer sp. TRSA002]|uniref:hypothetical protein n=1 Tax=Microbulbifer sp. TRSA002 TaxID=3243382 RepID=UPI0040398206
MTTMRHGDICGLLPDEHIIEAGICKRVEKPINQRNNEERPVYLRLTFSRHPGLRQIINRAREFPLKNYLCPFAISYTPKKRQSRAKEDEHWYQLSNQFREMNDRAGVRSDPPNKVHPTVHEIRPLPSHLLDKSGHGHEDIAKICGHTDV